MSELDKNYNIVSNSFLYNLKNLGLFDRRKLHFLISDIVKLIKKCSILESDNDKNKLVVEYAPKLFHIYDITRRLLASHYDSTRSYNIKNFNDYDDYEWIDRFHFVIFAALTKEDYSRILDYEDELGKLVKE